MTKNHKIYLYDTLMRDGAQTQGVDFTVNDKIEIAKEIDALGIDYIEAGFPGANPTDDEFFAKAPKLKHSKLVGFGMTHKYGIRPQDDVKLRALAECSADIACIFGKAWDFHVTNALGITPHHNLEIVESSVKYLVENGKEVFFDCEHFFDGYKNNPGHAIDVAKTALDAGAKWIILCDTNGGTLPHEISEITNAMEEYIPGEKLGIHCHNDTENAVANSLAAIRAGARQVQGTINGYGERCGNANLVAIIPTLKYKMDFDIAVSDKQMKLLKRTSDLLDERLNRMHYRHAAYVGDSAFAHKGGLHVSAVNKSPAAYEHLNPELVGNERIIVVSDQSGKSNIVNRLKGFGIKADDEAVDKLVKTIKERENEGYAYDYADASFELLARKAVENLEDYFEVSSFRIIDERRKNAAGEFVNVAEATVKVVVSGKTHNEIAEGNGPVDALSKAIKKALVRKYPEIKDIGLIDYKVRIMKRERGTGAVTRVQIESKDSSGKRWNTIGVSSNILDASFNALRDSISYKIMKERAAKT
jgi:2-isopropylmalate synthase